MNTHQKLFLFEVLEIIKYEGDKDEFVVDFIAKVIERTLAEILQNLPEEKQEELSQTLNSISEPEKKIEVISSYFDKATYQKTFEAATQQLTKDFILAILPSLSDEQHEKLQSYAQSLQSS